MARRRVRPDLTAAALASLAAGIVALALSVANPFAHGIWLVAYLVLVGFLAQLLLGRGQAALLVGTGLPVTTRGVRLAQVLLWNLGVVAVPLGVLADTRLAVVAGSVSLLSALGSFWTSARPAMPGSAHASRLSWPYALLLVAMTVSTLIGLALAWDIPWT